MNENKKYYMMGGSIIAVILVLLLSMMLLSSCSSKANYQKIEKKLIKAAEKAVTNGDVTITEGSSMIVTSDQLEQAGYLKSLAKMNKDNCSATVTIMNNGESYNYLPNLICTNYQTKTLKSKMIDDSLTTKDAGLYYDNGEYIFKGTNPNNIVSFGGSLWFILKIDGSGNLKLLNTEQSAQYTSWDSKFNTDTNDRSGENVYENSDIHEVLKAKYDGYKINERKHLIPFGVCIGKRTPDNIAKTAYVDCGEKLEGQYLGLMSPSDYALASYDPDCENILSGSCTNYNYIYKNITSDTWTSNAMADNSYEVMIYSPGRIRRATANETYYYNLVVYVSGDELYTEGDGSVDNPYVIK